MHIIDARCSDGSETALTMQLFTGKQQKESRDHHLNTRPLDSQKLRMFCELKLDLFYRIKLNVFWKINKIFQALCTFSFL